MNFAPYQRFAQRLTDQTLKRVLLTGMGSSFHALYPLRLALIAQGIQTEMFETSELIHFAPRLLSPDTLVVAVSQSGRSAEILQLLDLIHKDAPLIGVTNTPDSPLAQKSSAVLLTRAGEEYSVSCKTYVAGLAALLLLGDLLTGRDPAETIAVIRASIGLTAEYLSHWEAVRRIRGAGIIRHSAPDSCRPGNLPGGGWHRRIDHQGSGALPRRGDEQCRFPSRAA